MSRLTQRQERYQKIIADYHLITDSIKINSTQGELIFKFVSHKKGTETEIIKTELGEIFDYARALDIEVSPQEYQDGEHLLSTDSQGVSQLLTGINPKISNILLVNTLMAEGNTFYVRGRSTGAIDGETLAIFSSRFKRLISENYGLDSELVVRFTDEESVAEKSQEDLNKRLATIKPVISKPTGSGGTATAKLPKAEKPGDVVMGRRIINPIQLLRAVDFNINSEFEGKTIVVRGSVFGVNTRPLKSGKTLLTFNITDDTSSITCKIFTDKEEVVAAIREGGWYRVEGKINYDDFSQEMMLYPRNINLDQETIRTDDAPVKRVELHLHSQFSAMDAVSKVEKIMKQASDFGHDVIGITDHGVLQAYPEMMELGRKKKIKVLYGVEGYLVEDRLDMVFGDKDQDFSGEFVFFDLETTGLVPGNHKIIEIAAVKIKNRQIIESFTALVNPHSEIPPFISDLTGITNQMVENGIEEADALQQFLAFAEDRILVAHNAPFDMSFFNTALESHGIKRENTSVDTLAMSRCLLTNMARHTLKKLCSHFKIDLQNHHRALDDAAASAKVFVKLLGLAEKKGCTSIQTLNSLSSRERSIRINATNHIIVYARNQEGIKDLYRLVSESHLNYYYKKPRLPKSLLAENRENLLIGSACEAGELFTALVHNKSKTEIHQIADFYDYLEIQPLGNNQYLIDNNSVPDQEALKELNRRIIELGRDLNKPVVATGDVHFVNKEDALYREILFTGQGYKDAHKQPPLYYRNTQEMLAEFDYLEEDTARAVVIDNPRKVAEMIDEVLPIPDGTFPPVIEGSDDEIRTMVENRTRELYGDPLPEIVEKRMNRELDSIIGNGYSVLYLIAQKLVHHSNEDGYLVGSRGSVGSSFVATMCGITEVNPLSPHYRCPSCKHSEFFNAADMGVGPDLKNKDCPECGTMMEKDGFEIPFETFLGFEGDKEPDIDLNFSGENQAEAHRYTEVLFGKGKVFRAGTISTVAEKTAFGFVKNYYEEKEIKVPRAEMDRVIKNCAGIKKTTGQHPGGIMVVPTYKDIYDFCPVQHPADDTESTTTTTHFAYESLSGRMLKLDILGHDDPTMLRMLQDLTGIDPQTIPLDDVKVMSLFGSTKALDFQDDSFESPLGVCGVPEFGTSFVREMLLDTKPSAFSDLIRISGLSHGTDVWLNNAQELIRQKTVTIKDAICTRDDIMTYLLNAGMEAKTAFTIMEKVRKGKGLTPEFEKDMRDNKVPEWYIDSCKKIKYMFPKAHAAAYVMSAFRIAWYKVYYPLAYYATYFSIRASEFDAQLVSQGKSAVMMRMNQIRELGIKASNKEKGLLTVLELVHEMLCRGYSFRNVDVYESHYSKFRIVENDLMPPLSALDGIGEKAAQRIFEEAQLRPYMSREDLQNRTKVGKAVIETLEKQGCLNQLPASNQITFF
ncbi:PolC-type DNA polymerase III [Acetobacterium fimetarium]|uniref:DNA polymerase III PolC-type n=1 Tax=Acetobacterium fimetarium TaxID=52691 RepID=A0ABR6WXX4_9FIRM|nr:PolC-type DNA polymerase III [Acetobacterium fimetarium]MBC3805346.1 PolC-type DNA polymerase III [Acetobacterium fimetarium]